MHACVRARSAWRIGTDPREGLDTITRGTSEPANLSSGDGVFGDCLFVIVSFDSGAEGELLSGPTQ